MQIQALNNASFGHVANHQEAQRQFEDAVLSLNERDIRTISLIDASQKVNDKGYRRRHNALLLSLPVLYGARDALFTDVKDGLFNGKLKGPAARAAVGGATAAGWLGIMAVAGGVFGLSNLLARKNESVGEFNRNHPVLATVGTLAASVAAWVGASVGINKLLEKFSDKNADKIEKGIVKFNKNFNENNLVKKVQNGYRKFAKNGSKGWKNVAKYSAWYLPAVAFWTVLLSPIAHGIKKSQIANANVAQIHQCQKAIMESRMAEANMQNEG